ncbi:PREDICTED: uncharacterized protein LOC109124917 isoform X2 [Camelina sativa]|uniref:Uncharacterized protein LOC109124917 isoform X2 n=1 Tax=Camelina sativa TaxID=90675 RepID=A0ABM1RQS2_CAMSA|nr:PREDICTED: uncharacterized protein LOC109124917 isoform X2 [Camelina sativa]
MKQVILVCGNWIFDNNKWLFVVDNERGSRILQCNDQSRFDDCIGMVYEDYRLDNKVFDVVLSYKISKRLLQDLPGDTPPVIIDNSRQLHTFLGQLERDTGRLCVEVKKKIQTDLNHIGKKRGRDENDQVGEEYLDMASDTNEEEMDEDDSRFDYCDDSDGTDSDDENFTLYGIPPEEEDHKLPMKKRSSSFYIEENKEPVDVSKVDLSSVNLAVGQMYDTKEHLKTRLKILTLVQRFDYYVYKSRPTLLIVKCWVKGCKWRVTAATLRHFPKFEVRVFISAHTCSVTERSMRARQADHHILGELYKDFVGGVGPKMDYWKAYRTLRHARKLVRGSPESGYEQLPTYLYMIKRANPGTFTQLDVDEAQRFKYCFLAFGASIQGFPFLRKVVVVDGTFLQGKYLGTLLTATAQDGNFQIFPIAFAVVDTENDESWEWFFKQLSCVILDDESLSIIYDRHQSIGKAIKKVYPKSSRGICTYHMYKNILVRFKGRAEFALVKKAANAFRLIDFQTTFDQIEAMNPALHEYLVRADVRMWTRVHFPGDRYNLLTSNIAESMNKVMSHARSFPIVQLLEEIRSMMTRWFSDRRTDALKMTTNLTRGVEKIFQVCSFLSFLSKCVCYTTKFLI